MRDQAARFDQMLPWARLTGGLLESVHPYERLVHLRPSAKLIRVVDLDPSRPQLQLGEINSVIGADQKLVQLMAAKPSNAPQRATPEKRLQSHLIAAAYGNQRKLLLLSDDLVFVTDEQVFYRGARRAVCDVLAVRQTAIGYVPVTIELKTERQMKRLITQLDDAATVIDAHLQQFAGIVGAILKRDVVLIGPCERWLVWPATDHPVDPRTSELAKLRIRVKGYRTHGDGYVFV